MERRPYQSKLIPAHSYISGTANMIKLFLHETALMTISSEGASSEVFHLILCSGDYKMHFEGLLPICV